MRTDSASVKPSIPSDVCLRKPSVRPNVLWVVDFSKFGDNYSSGASTRDHPYGGGRTRDITYCKEMTCGVAVGLAFLDDLVASGTIARYGKKAPSHRENKA